MEGTVDPVPALGQRVVQERLGVGRVGDVELEAPRAPRGACGPCAAVRRRPRPGPGEHDLGALLLGEAGDPERERGVGEHPGDHDPFAVQQPHWRSCRRACGPRLACRSDRPGFRDVTPKGLHSDGCTSVCSAPPARREALSRCVSPRWATTSPSVPARSTGRSRCATGSSRPGPTIDLDIDAADNQGAADAELIVIATPWNAATETAHSVASKLRGKVVICMSNALSKVGREFQPLVPPRGSVSASVQAELRRLLRGRGVPPRAGS